MMTFRFNRILLGLGFSLLTSPALAGLADVVDAKVVLTKANTYRFDVSVLHADEGWEHYANAFEILDLDGNVLGVRELVHPHVNEQPFTRSLGNLIIPESISAVTIRAVDSVHGVGGAEMVLQLPNN